MHCIDRLILCTILLNKLYDYFISIIASHVIFSLQVLGNHEFDDKIAGVVPFLQNLNHSVVVSNIDDSLEPSIQGLYNKSTVIERNGKKIGIIGVIIHNCNVSKIIHTILPR